MNTDQFCESFTELYHQWNLVCITKGEFDIQDILDNLQHLGIEKPLNILHNGGEGDLLESIGEETWTDEEPGEYAWPDEMLLQQAIYLCEDRMKRVREIPLGWEGNYPSRPIRDVATLKEWMKDSRDELLKAEDRSQD